MQIDRTIKVGVISSLIAACAFIYLIEPIVSFVTYALFTGTGTLFQTYKDRLFEQAALLHGPDPSLHLLFLSCGILSGFAFAIFITPYFRPKLRNAAGGQDLPRFWLRRQAVPVLCLCLIVGQLFMIYSTMFQLRIVTSFNQHITTVGPHVPEKELLILKSEWTQMESEEDYKQIYVKLQDIAAQNNIRLPGNKVFSLTSL